MRASPPSDRKTVNFALQGRGAHGAFVWGVLDQVLEDGRLAIEAISATSAGAMNAVALASGMASGGGEAARESLHAFWYEVSRMDMAYDLLSPLNQWIQALRLPPEYHPVHAVIHTLTHTLPPSLLNPFHFNPLRALLQRVVDFDRLNSSPEAPQLFLNATNVRTGKIKVFQSPLLTAETVLASACLPPYFQAVEIDGEHYWDGGYLGNPAIYPLIYRKGSHDVVIVQVTAIRRDELPTSAADVLHRINEISFNSSLMREMRDRLRDPADRRRRARQRQAQPHVHALDRQRPTDVAARHGHAIPSRMEPVVPPARCGPRGGAKLAGAKLRPDRKGLDRRPRGHVSLKRENNPMHRSRG